MKPRILLGALLLSTALVLPAGSARAATSHSSYLAKANAVCSRISDTRQTLAKQYFPGGTDKAPTLAQLQAFYGAFAPKFKRQVEELAAITPNKADKPTVDRFIAGSRHLVEQIAKAGKDKVYAQHLLDTDEAEFHTDDAAMEKFGLRC